MWPFRKIHPHLPIPAFTNTLSGQKEVFVPHRLGKATIYSCGPTVYGPIQIGNLRAFVTSDLVARTLLLAGYNVRRVMNITDVGHLVDDADIGEDKIAVGAKREQKTPLQIADQYTALFLKHIKALGIDTPRITFPRATAYIKEDVEMIRTLERRGYTYRTADGVYFDTTKFEGYGMLGNRTEETIQAGARVPMGEKRSPRDFVLWRFAKPHDLQKWDSPWGEGNPGWSIECSVMASSLLGSQIDIHTGGEDLASVHHNNEIAQSEGASGKHPFVRYWLHNAFLTMDGEKLSKSKGNSFTLEDIEARGFHPLALRYLFLQAHYRSPLSFSWEALESAQDALLKLWRHARTLQEKVKSKNHFSPNEIKLRTLLYDDVGTPQGLAFLWNTLNDPALPVEEKWSLMRTADSVFGLSLTHPPEGEKTFTTDELPEEIKEVAKRRVKARAEGDFSTSDELRIHLQERGYRVEDTPSGPTYTKIRG